MDLVRTEDTLDARAAAFVLADTIRLWRDSMTKKK